MMYVFLLDINVNASCTIIDDKVWDAFVSYKSDGADEDFVLHKLQPILEEQLGFRLCLHYRDFVIGAGEYTSVRKLEEGASRTPDIEDGASRTPDLEDGASRTPNLQI